MSSEKEITYLKSFYLIKKKKGFTYIKSSRGSRRGIKCTKVMLERKMSEKGSKLEDGEKERSGEV